MLQHAPRAVAVASILIVLAGCGGTDDRSDVRQEVAPEDTGGDGDALPACGGCPDGKLCCPSRFEGDVDRCVDPDLNPENCGRCGNFCDGACLDGACVAAPECQAGGSCPADLTCSADGGGTGRCCPAGTTFIRSPADFFGCCPDGDICGCREGMCPISRRAAKRDIHYLDGAEIEALARELLATRLATYSYVGEPGHEHLGFIIDDGGSRYAVAPGGRTVDLYGFVSLAVATLQQQERRIESLEQRLELLVEQCRER